MANIALHELHVPRTCFTRLFMHLLLHRPGVEPGPFVAELIDRWLTVEEDRLALEQHEQRRHGYQWKEIFLPHGTDLRTQHKDQTRYAQIVGDAMQSETGASSPSALANALKAGRSAWRFVWLRLPGTSHWVRASDLRRRVLDEQARQARLIASWDTAPPSTAAEID